MCKGDLATRIEVEHLARRCLPELEVHLLACHLFATIYGEEQFGVVGGGIKGYVSHTYALVAIEGIYSVVRIGIIYRTAVSRMDHYLTANRHIERIFALIHFFIRRISLHVIFNLQRLAKAVLVGQIDNVHIFACGHVGVVIEAYNLVLHRVNRAVRLVNGQPVG